MFPPRYSLYPTDVATLGGSVVFDAVLIYALAVTRLPASLQLPDKSQEERLARLTERQRECVRLISSGLRTKEIARLVGISPGRVDSHIRDARKLVGVNDRRILAALLEKYEAGLAAGDTAPNATAGTMEAPSCADPATAITEMSNSILEDRGFGGDRRPWHALSAMWPALGGGPWKNDLNFGEIVVMVLLIAILGATLAGAGFGSFLFADRVNVELGHHHR